MRARKRRAGSRAKGRRGPDRSGKHHVTAVRDRRRFAQERGRPLPMEDTSDQRGWPHLHGGPASWSRRPQEALLVRKRSRGEWGGDRGVRGSARSGVRGRRTPRANPVGPPKRIGRRETPGPPVLWPWVQAQGQGRSASFEEMPESDEARVLVVEVVGSRSRLVRIEVELHGASQGKP